ncbi:MAG: sigma-70 family RNA polymerase sigma factor [Acidimicrobiales bacterium]
MTSLLTGRSSGPGRAPLGDDVDIARDRVLIARAQGGDREAFDQLYLHYYRRIVRVCLRRLRDAHEAEDVAQEAFVRAWRALPGFCGERRFYPWLRVIASNLCTDVQRKRARSVPVAEVFGADPASADGAPDERVLGAADALTAGTAFARLTERHRRVLDLRENRGLSYQAIADHEGVALSAVETLLWRARQALKREFAALSASDRSLGGLGVLGASLAVLRRLLRLPVHVTRRLVHLGPVSALVTVGSVAGTSAVLVVAGTGVPVASLPAPLAPAAIAPSSLASNGSGLGPPTRGAEAAGSGGLPGPGLEPGPVPAGTDASGDDASVPGGDVPPGGARSGGFAEEGQASPVVTSSGAGDWGSAAVGSLATAISASAAGDVAATVVTATDGAGGVLDAAGGAVSQTIAPVTTAVNGAPASGSGGNPVSTVTGVLGTVVNPVPSSASTASALTSTITTTAGNTVGSVGTVLGGTSGAGATPVPSAPGSPAAGGSGPGPALPATTPGPPSSSGTPGSDGVGGLLGAVLG